MTKIHRIFFLFFISLLFFFTSCSDKNRMYLSDFEYSITGKDGTYFPIEDNKTLKKLSTLLPDKQGYIWIRTYFTIPENLSDKNLGIFLGITKIAEKCYLNGTYIGKSGEMPPYEFSSGEVPTYFFLPPSLLYSNNEQNILEINFWSDIQGSMDSMPFIGEYDDVYNSFLLQSFTGSKVSLIISFIMIVVSFIYFVLFLFRPKEKANLSFSRMNFCSAFYMLTMCIGEYPSFKISKFTSYLLYLKLFTGIAAIITAYFAVSFIRDYMNRTDSLRRHFYRLLITIIPSLALLVPKNIHDFFIILGFSYLLLALQIFYAIRILITEIKKKNKNFNSLIIGFTPVLISLIIEVVLMIFKYPFNKLIVVIGWQLTILTFLAILILKFAKTSNQVEYLNNNLEIIVKDRTTDLQKANKLLEESNQHLKYERQRAQTEIDLAAFVQQSFYSNNVPILKDWDIGFYFKPLTGVSGDLYDFYFENNRLDGFGIFDVSGHGIASGLVTMLVKNIIHQEFYEARKYPIEDVMDIINYRVIEEKGNIENYLTGILARVIGPNTIEFINAGHPLPILYSKADNVAEGLSSSTKQYGVIGIQDFPINFKSQQIELYSQDALLLYTDGIIEAENEKHEPYGLSRLVACFEKTQNLSIPEQINEILSDIKTFIDSDIINDDVTILIIRKK